METQEVIEMSDLDILEARRLVLVAEKQELSHSLAGLGLSKNRKKSRFGTIPDSVVGFRDVWASRVSQIEIELREIKQNIQKHKGETPNETQIVKDILAETFGSEFSRLVFIELGRRCQNEHPCKVHAPERKHIKTFIKEALQYQDMLISARTAINAYILENEPENNKADYLNKVKELNRCLPPISELLKMKKALI